MGHNTDDFQAFVLAVVQKYVQGLTMDAASSHLSKEGRFISVTVTILAESREQLDTIYQELSAHERVLMML